MNDVLSAVEQLLQRKADLLGEVESIDEQVDRIRLALGKGPPIQSNRNYKHPREIRPDGTMPNEIVAALAVREPRTIRDIAAYTKRTTAHISLVLTPMVRTGRVFRTQIQGQGRAYVYARSEAALRAFTDAPTPPANPPPGDDDELGQGTPAKSVPEAAVSTTSEAGISQ
jgi:hypothetical protein